MRRRSRIDPLDVVLGEVPPELAEEAALRLRDDERLRAEVERLGPVAARLEALPPEVWTPPPAPPLEVGAPVPPPRRSWPRRALVLRPAVALAASALLVAAGIAGGILIPGDDSGDPPRELAVPLLPLDRSVPGGAARGTEAGRAVVVGDGRVRVEVRGAAADGEGAYHELWLLPKAGDPVPVGRFRVEGDGHGTATFPLPADPERFAYFDVSEEPADGDPAHSGRSILRAPV